jgi:tRNA modification GTPase
MTPPIAETTVAAVLTAPSRGAIAVVGLRGRQALSIADRLFQPKGAVPLSHSPVGRLRVGRLGGPAGEEVVAVVRDRAEQAVEFHCHGGTAPVAALQRALQDAGAIIIPAAQWIAAEGPSRLAAEALSALPLAPTLRAAAILLDQAEGALARELEAIVEALPDRPAPALEGLSRLIDRAEIGLRLRDGWSIALVGRPNVGKSRLLNALAGFERAIVSPQAGTTRDVVTTASALDGWPVTLIDTAGQREALDPIEASGVALARRQQDEADVVLAVLDGSEPLTAEDRAVLNRTPKALRVASKADLPARWHPEELGAIAVSSVTGDGIDELVQAIARRMVSVPPEVDSGIPFEPHHLRRLRRCQRLIQAGRLDPARRALVCWLSH